MQLPDLMPDFGCLWVFDEQKCRSQTFIFIRYIQSMWKSIGSIKNGDEVSIRSNRSRSEINLEPFHQSLKRRSNLSPDMNRSFCYEYFEKRRNKTLNESIHENKSERNIISGGSNQDIFTEMRNKATKEDQGSRITDRARDNPEAQKNNKKSIEQLKKATNRIYNLKKEQTRLKNTMQHQFNAFKNLFYQLEEHIHQHQNDQLPTQTVTPPVDQAFFREILGQAMGIERYFQEMDRKKTVLMERLTQ